VTSFLDRLLGRPDTPAPSAKAVTSLHPWNTGPSLSLYSQEPQQKAAAYLRAYNVGWFGKAGRKIANDVSSLDWSLSEGDAEEGDQEATLDRPTMDQPFSVLSPVDQFQRLLEAPYRREEDDKTLITGRALLHKTQVHLDFTGNACWYLAGGAGGGLPTAIMPISPARMWPVRSRSGDLVGWIMDKDKPSGGVPFDVDEILWFSTGGTGDDVWGSSVVECVYSQVPITDLMARHTANVMTTGGRLAGMMWPKERSLTEDEFVDAQRAWRNVASDPEAGKRLLIFPEPMEFQQGASTPAEIGVPELAVLNRDEILTAFPIDPHMLGVPMPSGLNASGETRAVLEKAYWRHTIAPRTDLIEETVQVGLLVRYEAVMGQTYDFELAIPNLDDAPSLMEKAAAYKGLISIGLDPKEALKAVGLSHIKWLGLPPLLDPVRQAEAAAAAQEAIGDGSRTVVRDNTPRDNTNTQQTIVGKATKAREDVAESHQSSIAAFLTGQRERVVEAIRKTMPTSKAARISATKADPEWFDKAAEDAALRETVARLYVDAGQASLQVVADQLNRIVPNRAVTRVIDDLMTYGGERIADINAKTLQSITMELAEGARRGYSIAQLIDGVPAEGFKGVLSVGLENGVGVWGDARAETIARTETALSYNRAALDAYKEFRVSRVLAYDGDGDPDCARRNGQEFSVDDAFGIADHPNGTLDWAPVVEDRKSYDLPDNTVTVDVGSPVINLHMPEVNVPAQKAPVVNVAPAAVTVTTPDVTVNVPEQKAPVVHVAAPEVSFTAPEPIVNVTTPETVVNVPAPIINVAAPEAPIVNVTTPETKAPVINVKATPPDVTVNMVPELRITGMPDRVTTREVKRDKQGRIVETTDVEVDA
jgi:hypothetical protein